MFMDRRLHPEDADEEGTEVPPRRHRSWRDPELLRPTAVTKFSAREDLCLAGLSKKQLQPGTAHSDVGSKRNKLSRYPLISPPSKYGSITA